MASSPPAPGTFITPMFASLPAGASSVTFTTQFSERAAIVFGGILQNPTSPAQPNPNWPALRCELALGYQPGDLTAFPVWTDISSRIMQPDGSTMFESGRGKAYELATPEAGTHRIWINNQDGALNPANTASPYYPYITDMMLVRLSGYWDGRWYVISQGWATNVGQVWPDPQWGFSPVDSYDSMGVLANMTMLSAYQSEVLLDIPYSYWTLNEGYSAANGEPFNNLAQGNQNPLLGIDGGSDASGAKVPLSCGLTLGMTGDQGAGIGISGLTAAPRAWSAGAIGIDPGFPSFKSPVTIEFWTAFPQRPSYSFITPLVTFMGAPGNYTTGGGPIRCQMVADWPGGNSGVDIYVALSDFLGNQFNTHLSAHGPEIPLDGLPHHHVLTLSPSGSTYSLAYYVDGLRQFTATAGSVQSSNDITTLIVGPATNFMFAPGINQLRVGDYTIGQVAIYPKLLSQGRITAHYVTGAGSAGAGENNIQRFTRIMTYSGTSVARAGDLGSPSPLLSPADALDGQSAVDNIAAMMVTEGGNSYAAGDGTIFYQSRQTLYNQPSAWTFGDNPDNGEIPYEPSQSFDFDVTYLYNQVSAQRQASISKVPTVTSKGVTNTTFTNFGAQITVTDPDSVAQYMPRNSLQQTVLAMSDQDAHDRANWSLNKYRQPVYRLPSIVISPAGTHGAWAAALGVEQGDVVTIIRRPLGAPAYFVTGIVQRIEHSAGPNHWETTLMISPLNVEQGVLQIGATVNNALGSNRVGW